MSTLKNMIHNSIEKIRAHSSFVEFCKSQGIAEGDLIVINNSFVFRDLNTTKAESYIAIKYGKDKFQKEPFISRNLNPKTDFSFYSSKHKKTPSLISIEEAIEEQISQIGQVVFLLIGNIEDNIVLEEDFTKSGFKTITWNPTSKYLLKVFETNIEIKNPYDESVLWQEFISECQKNKIKIDEAVTKSEFGVVLDKLQGKAEAKLVLPTTKKEHGITDVIVDALRKRKNDYASAVTRCDGKPEKDKEAFNEALRISYNFSNDVIPLLKLAISICDI